MKFPKALTLNITRWAGTFLALAALFFVQPQAFAQQTADPPKSKSGAAQTSATAQQSVQSKSIAVGEAFPNFELKDQDGNVFRLKETLKEGPVVLVVYRSADW